MSNITDYENPISALIAQQFPSFYREEGQSFVAFLEAYYAWMELEGKPLYMGRHLLSYRDIDTTPDEFILFFKNKYLNNIQFQQASNKRLFIKNSLDFYRSKGTSRAVDLFFRLIYGVNADVYLPGEDTFRLSSGEWIKPTYLEITHTEDNPDYVGKTITGMTSGATAFVDRLVRRRINSKYVDVFYISALNGDFSTNERLTIEGDTELVNNPIVIGSLSSASILSGSNSFVVGDTLYISSNNGLQGKATVTGITNSSGQVDWELVESGWGYTVNAEVIISNTVMGLSNVTTTNSTISNAFTQFEKINQPLANIVYGSLSGGTFANGNVIEKYFANGSVAGTGTIISTTATNSTAGSILCTIGLYANGSLSNLNFTSAFAKQGNVVTATTTTYTNKTASANVVGIGSNTMLVVNNTSASFTVGEYVYQGGPTSQTANGTVYAISTNSSAVILSLNSFAGIFFSNGIVTGATSNTTANVVSFTASVGVANVTNTFYVGYGHVVGLSSNTFANLVSNSTGNGASISFSNISYVESAYFNSDLIGANNSGGVPFLGIVLDGSSGSNLASNSYGFAKKPTANINTRIFDALNYSLMNVGVISALTNVNPGNSYSVNPMVVFYEKYYAGLYNLYYRVTIQNPSRDYTQGEIVEQTITFSNSVTLNVNNSSNTWQVGEWMYQQNATANIATGILYAQTVIANVGQLFIQTVTGAFVTNSTARVNGLTSGATANISAVNTTSFFANAKGIIQSQVNSSFLNVKRLSTLSLSNTGANLVGSTSGATSTVYNVDFQSPPQSGLNANIGANVATANGVVANLSIFDSGFGYIANETATFTSEDGSRSGTLSLILEKQGVSEGYFKSTKGMLSTDKYLFDGDYYQDFSYEVRSPLPFELYSDILKKVLHLAGTKPFGKVITQSITTSNAEAWEPGVNVATANVSLFVTTTSNTAQFAAGELIYQANATANLGFANTQAKLKSAITIATTNVNFIPGSYIQQPNATTNAAFGYVQALVANSTATTVYVINCTASFNATANVFGPARYVCAVLPKVRMRFNSLTGASNTTMSFAIGENIYQGTLGSQTANGTVLNATDGLIEIRPTSGTFANGTTMTGATSGATANLQSYSNSAFLAGESIQVDRTLVFYTGANGTFSNGEFVYQYKRNPNLSNVQLVNTAVGLVIAKNSTCLTISNKFGTFVNNALVFGATSLANANINKIRKLTNSTATVIAANSTQGNVYLIIGDWANGLSLFGNTSNTYANLTSFTVNNDNFAVSSVINTLDVQIVNGAFVSNSTVNTITGVTSGDTATISGLTFEQI